MCGRQVAVRLHHKSFDQATMTRNTTETDHLASSGPPSNRGALLVIFLTVFIDLAGFGIVLPLLPLYAEEFGADEFGFKIGLLMASYSIMQFIFAPIWGRISDQVGRRPILMLGLAGSVVFYSLFGIAAIYKSFWGLMAARIGAGIAGATIPTAQAYIADTTSHAERTRGMALIGMAFGLGFALGPAFALAAITAGGGQELGAGPGFLAAAFSAGALVLAIFKLPEPTRRAPRDHSPWWNAGAWSRALASAAGAILILGFFLHTLAFALYETSLSLFLRGSEDFSYRPFEFSFPQIVGTFAALGLLAALYQGLVVRRLAKTISSRTLALTGTSLEALGFLLVATAAALGSFNVLMLSFFVVIAGFGFLQPSLFGLISQRADARHQGATLGVAQSASAMARILGALFSVVLLKRAGVSAPYVISGLLGLGSMLAIYWATRLPQTDPEAKGSIELD